jgi:hypothetical protein
MSDRYSDFDILQNEARFIAQGKNILAIPVKCYSTFLEIEDWYKKEENQKIVSDLLKFPQTRKAVLWRHQFPDCYCPDTDLAQLLVDECFHSLNCGGDYPPGFFDTFVQCSWCGGLPFGFYCKSDDYFFEPMSCCPSPEEKYLVNWCSLHDGPFKKNKGYLCPWRTLIG